MSLLSKTLLFGRTVAHLRPTQIVYQLRYRLWSRPRLRHKVLPPLAQIQPLSFVVPPVMCLRSCDWQFTFLNRARRFPLDAMDWRASDETKLWRYNLHYLDCVLSPTLHSEAKASLIDSWIAQNPPGTEDAWEPYPISLRLVNLVKFLSTFPADGIPQHWIESMVLQARWLEQRLEFHLLANHLLKNAVALLFVGVFFRGADGARWLRKGKELLAREMEEQFLEDGGHFERSPMYHAICVVDCLDVLNLLQGVQDPPANAVRAAILKIIRPAMAFMRDVELPDGRLSLFNDAAHGIAPVPFEIRRYAQTLLASGEDPEETPSGLIPISRPATGYFGYRHGDEALIIDCGPIGPDYQPGHAHCDTLSFEWVLDGRRVVVDAGTFDYEAGPRRAYARGTRGHNTVMVDGAEQSEIWGVFRVARRARAKLARAEANGSRFVFEGGHDGYRRLPGRPYVSRRLIREAPGQLWVEERVEGRGRHKAESFLHFAPGFDVDLKRTHASVSSEDGLLQLVIEFIGSPGVFLRDGEHYPEFGIVQQNTELVLSLEGQLPLSFGYRIRKAV